MPHTGGPNIQTTAQRGSTGDQEKVSDQSFQVTAPNLALSKGSGNRHACARKLSSRVVDENDCLLVRVAESFRRLRGVALE
jgi:hypothetical protein